MLIPSKSSVCLLYLQPGASQWHGLVFRCGMDTPPREDGEARHLYTWHLSGRVFATAATTPTMDGESCLSRGSLSFRDSQLVEFCFYRPAEEQKFEVSPAGPPHRTKETEEAPSLACTPHTPARESTLVRYGMGHREAGRTQQP